MVAIRVNDKQIRALLADAKDQIPFAISRALNKTVWEARTHLVNTLPDYFVIRNTWTARGMRVEKAHKRHLVARVGSVRPYMLAQTVGEERTEHGLAVPLLGQGRPRRVLTARTTPSVWPRALTRRRNIFIGRAGLGWSAGGGVYGVWQRLPRAVRSKTAKRGLRLLWRIAERVRVPPRWPLGNLVESVVRRRWSQICLEAIDEALKTRR